MSTFPWREMGRLCHGRQSEPIMARLRTFIAVDLDRAVRSRCVTLQETLARSAADVRWVTPESMHLTLLFLGEVDERDLLPVCRAAADACAGQDAFVNVAAGGYWSSSTYELDSTYAYLADLSVASVANSNSVLPHFSISGLFLNVWPVRTGSQ